MHEQRGKNLLPLLLLPGGDDDDIDDDDGDDSGDLLVDARNKLRKVKINLENREVKHKMKIQNSNEKKNFLASKICCACCRYRIYLLTYAVRMKIVSRDCDQQRKAHKC